MTNLQLLKRAEAVFARRPDLLPTPATGDSGPTGRGGDPTLTGIEPVASTSGIEEKQGAVTELINRAKESQDVTLVFDSIDLLAALTEVELGKCEVALKKALGRQFPSRRFNKALQEARNEIKRQAKQATQASQTRIRPDIQLNDRPLDNVSGDAVRALESANSPPVLFRREGRFCTLTDRGGTTVISTCDLATVRGHLSRAATFSVEGRGGPTLVSPSLDVVNDVMAMGEGNFPELEAVTQTPIVRPDFSLHFQAGYDPVTRVYFKPESDFQLDGLVENPTRAHAVECAGRLSQPFEQFPFVGAPDRANAIGLMIGIMLRPSLRGPTPLAVVDSPKGGTGKSLLVSAVHMLITGQPASVTPFPEREEEVRKKVLAELERGAPIVVFDNVDTAVRSPVLAPF